MCSIIRNLKTVGGLMAFKTLSLLIALVLCAGVHQSASAQSLAGVFGPGVYEGDKSVQYRTAFVPEENGRDLRYAHRFHYQQSLNGDFRLRGVIVGSDTGAGDFEYRFVQGELQWELTPEGSNVWSTGLRFDGRLADANAPDQVGVNWTNQFDFAPDWHARAIVLTTVQIGDRARDGIGLQTRFSLHRALGNGLGLNAELFNNYGFSDDFGSFEQQNHALGLTASKSLGGGWSVYGGGIFGLQKTPPIRITGSGSPGPFRYQPPGFRKSVLPSATP